MANKRQKRMEEPPEDKTGMGGSKRKVDVKINIDDLGDLPRWSKADMDRAMESMRKAIKAGEVFVERSYSFGGKGQQRGSGNIFIEGMQDFNRQLGGTLRNTFGQNWMQLLYGEEGGGRVDFKDAVSRLLHSKAIEVWDSLLNWQFAATYNDGQATFWFTARYYDVEEIDNSLPLVSETLEFSAEVLSKRNWDESNLEVERQMERLHEKCQADLAAFE